MPPPPAPRPLHRGPGATTQPAPGVNAGARGAARARYSRRRPRGRRSALTRLPRHNSWVPPSPLRSPAPAPAPARWRARRAARHGPPRCRLSFAMIVVNVTLVLLFASLALVLHGGAGGRGRRRKIKSPASRCSPETLLRESRGTSTDGISCSMDHSLQKRLPLTFVKADRGLGATAHDERLSLLMQIVSTNAVGRQTYGKVAAIPRDRGRNPAMPNQPQIVMILWCRAKVVRARRRQRKFFKKIRMRDLVARCCSTQNHRAVGGELPESDNVVDCRGRTSAVVVSLPPQGARDAWARKGRSRTARSHDAMVDHKNSQHQADGDIDRDVRDTGQNQACIPQYTVLERRRQGRPQGRHCSTQPQAAEGDDNGVASATTRPASPFPTKRRRRAPPPPRSSPRATGGRTLSKACHSKEAFRATKFGQR